MNTQTKPKLLTSNKKFIIPLKVKKKFRMSINAIHKHAISFSVIFSRIKDFRLILLNETVQLICFSLYDLEHFLYVLYISILNNRRKLYLRNEFYSNFMI